jgi:Cu/Zn superoxide dismutase
MRPVGSDALICAFCTVLVGSLPGHASAASVRATVELAGMQGPGEEYGTITLSDYQGGLRIQPKLHGLPEGRYDVELHQGSSCEVTYESHPGPEGASPLMPVPAGGAGDWLPTAAGKTAVGLIAVRPDGTAMDAINVPQVPNASQFKGRSVIIRGERLLCGVLR